MKTFQSPISRGFFSPVVRSGAALLGLAIVAAAAAAATDIADAPINSTTISRAKPNIMLLMDTSISMSFTHAPDELEFGTSTAPLPPAAQPIGYRANQCNSLYYNPATVYRLPVNASGGNLGTPAFSAAPYDAYISGATPATNLDSQFQAFDHNSRALRSTNPSDWPTIEDKAQRAYYYLYAGGTALSPLAAPCTDTYDPATANTYGTLPAGGSWTRVLVGDPTTVAGTSGVDERANFAIWYTYYRTRMALAKSGIGLAFGGLTPPSENFRVGFITANPLAHAPGVAPAVGASVDPKYYQALGAFGDTPAAGATPATTNKTDWYSKLYAQTPEGTSPMREGLARVGRHYAHKDDLINKGMAIVDVDGVSKPNANDIPGNYSCQQNFTIMTTDGYWNRSAETLGAVAIDGSLVGQRDGVLNAVDAYGYGLNVTPRPIWDGGTTGSITTTDNTNNYSAANCPSGQWTRTTSQNLANTFQMLQSTSQPMRWTTQLQKGTAQISQSTSQVTQSTSQLQETDSQMQSNTVAITLSTSQINKTTTQITTSSTTQWTTQLNISTSNITKSTSTIKVSTAQLQQSTLQNLKSTAAITQSTSQWNTSTAQLQQSTLQNKVATAQISTSTSQLTKSTLQSTQSTSQWWEYKTEGWTPSTCGVTSATCYQVTTGPTQVTPGSCVSAAASAGNSYTATTCVNTNTGPTAVSSCTPQTAGSGNGYLQINCVTVTTGPTPSASCTPVTAGSGNSYTATTCSTATTGPTAVASCSPVAASSGNAWTATTCSTVATGPTPVASCTPVSAASGPSYTATTCNTAVSGPTPGASCTPSGSASVSPYLVTTCNNVTTGPTAVASCTTASAGSGNNYIATNCSTATTGPTPVLSCSTASATSGNGYVSTSCGTNTTGPTPVATCTPVTAASGTAYTATTCNTATTGPTATGSCTPSGSASVSPYLVTTCATTTTGPTATGSCTNAAASSGNSWVATTCATATTGPTPTGSCTASGANSGNGYTTTTCPVVTTGAVTVASCTPVAASAGNNWTATVCGTTLPVGAGSCTPSASVVCGNIVVGPTPVASCTPAAASAGNSWTATTCNTVTTGPTPVASCATATAKASNSYTATTCNTNTSALSFVASCTTAAASAGNSYVATVCTPLVTGPTGVSACAAQAPVAGNAYKTIACNTVTTGPTGVSSCTPVTAASGNQWKTTNCGSVTTGPTLVASCANVAAASGNSWTATNCNTVTTGPTGVGSCTIAPAGAGNSFTSTTCNTVTSATVAVASCTPVAADGTNSYTATLCTAAATGPNPVGSCTNSPGLAGNSYVTTTCNPVSTGPTPVATCTLAAANAGNSYTATTCPAAVSTGPDLVATCTASAANAGNNFIATACNNFVNDRKVQYSTSTNISTQSLSNGINVGAPVVSNSTNATQDLDGVCYTQAQQPSLFIAAPAYAVSGLPPTIPVGVPTALTSVALPPAPCAAAHCVVNNGSTAGGSNNSLADVAQYYYVTDLRPDLADNVPAGSGTGLEDDRVKWQHMTTYTVGLGVSGALNYQSDYFASATGDFAAVRSGALSWPVWPDASFTSSTPDTLFSNKYSIDDFWHAAVNGRGRFFSARDPATMLSGLKGALDSIESAAGAGGRGAIVNPILSLGSNVILTTGFTSGKWTGDVQSQTFTVLASGSNPAVMGVGNAWSAQAKLDAVVAPKCDQRDIRLIHPGAPKNLVKFTWNTQTCDGSGAPTGGADTSLSAAEQAFFGASAGDVGSVAVDSLTQFVAAGASSAAQRAAAKGANLVNYLRGEKSFENYLAGDANHLYRVRDHALGDIINSSVAYVGKPSLGYLDSGYDTFKANNASRTPMAYVGANDGMLHAFNAPLDATLASGGTEAWAVIPTPVLPNLYKLADVSYGAHHQYFVDGTPIIGDVFTGGAWKTILVGGLNKGGRGYYALDITNPAAPAALWEYTVSTDSTMGLSFGRPVITKMADGTWVVLLTSGYNNTSPGDGKGYLYVINVGTGALIKRIGTGVVDSGLRELTTYVSNPLQDNSALRVYGGDVLGNVWRFDINGSSDQATLITTLYDTATPPAPQPITTRINLAEVDGSTFLMVGTGRLLGTSDVGDTQTQSVYSIKDPLTSPATPTSALIDPTQLRDLLKPMVLTTVAGTSAAAGTLVRTAACSGSAAACASTAGWALNLTEPRERINIDMGLAGESLVFQSNVPIDDACSTGYNLLNYINFQTGLPFDGPNSPVTKFGGITMAGGAGAVALPPGAASSCEIVQIVTNADGTTSFSCVPSGTPPPLGKRISWREISK